MQSNFQIKKLEPIISEPSEDLSILEKYLPGFEKYKENYKIEIDSDSGSCIINKLKGIGFFEYSVIDDKTSNTKYLKKQNNENTIEIKIKTYHDYPNFHETANFDTKNNNLQFLNRHYN